ncbi:MAG: hypothetical protein HZA31_08220 [Opitutae bacterium]|nr:hypothetical protein [Opitutae bacterium]
MRLLCLALLSLGLALSPLPAAETTVSAPAPTAGVAPAQDYAVLFAAAQRHAAEKSWALARDAYAAALPLAPDAEAQRWCQLRLADATWRAEDRSALQHKLKAAFAPLLVPYEQGRTRDDFWVAVLESRAELHRNLRFGGDRWNDLLAIADYYAEQPPAPKPLKCYLGFLASLTEFIDDISTASLAKLTKHLENATHIAPEADDRAWFALRAAALWRESKSSFAIPSDDARRYNPGSSDEAKSVLAECAERWMRALATAQGTRWEVLGRAQEFLWRHGHSWAPDRVADTRPDYFRLLADLGGWRYLLRNKPADTLTQQTLTWLDLLENEWTTPRLLLEMPKFVPPGEPARFSYGTMGCREMRFSVYRHTLESWAKQLPEPRSFRDEPDAIKATDIPPPDGAAKIHTWTQTISGSEPYIWHSEVVAIDATLPAGAYTLRIVGEGPAAPLCVQRTFLVTSIEAALVNARNGHKTLFLFSRESGAPITNTAVQGILRRVKTSQTWQAISDAQGRVNLPSAPSDDQSYRESLFILVGDEPVFRQDYRHTNDRDNSLLADVFIDRTLYRPGETVMWKLIVRERGDGRWIVPNTKLRMSVKLDDEMMLADTELSLNAFGTAHGELLIPPNARPGRADLTLSNTDHRKFRTTLFQVDNLVPPAIRATVTLSSPPDSVRPGGEISLRASAHYLSGGPAAGVPVSFQCRLRADMEEDEKQENVRQFERWKKELEDKPLLRRTDNQGAAEVRLTLPNHLPEGTTLLVETNTTPEGAISVRAKTGLKINRCGAWLDVSDWPHAFLAEPGKETVFTARVRDGEMKPRTFAGTVRLVERIWQEVWLSPERKIVSGPELSAARRQQSRNASADLPSPWKRLHAEYVDQTVAEFSLKTGADGLLTVPFVPPHAGIFQCQLWRGSQRVPPLFSNHLSDPLSIVAAAQHTTLLGFPPTTCHLIAPRSWKPGEPLRLFAVLPEGQHQGVLALAGEKSTSSQRVDLRARSGLIDIATPPHFSHQGSADLSPLQHIYRNYSAEAKFSVVYDNEPISISIQPEHDTLRPGTETNITLRTANNRQQSVQAELAISVSDEAIHQLLASRPITYKFPPKPDAIQPVFLRTDETVYTNIEAPSIGQELKLGPITDPRPCAGTTIPRYLGSGLTNVFGLRDSFGQDTKRSPITLRTHFASTAFWAPEVKTDAKGEARVTFKYPDNLTQWRVEAYAVGADGNSFGRVHAFTRTSLPFQARLQAPRFLIAGDTAWPSALLVNRTDAALTATAELKTAGAAQLSSNQAPASDMGETPMPRGTGVSPVGSASSGQPSQPDPSVSSPRPQTLAVAAQNEARALWCVRAAQPGAAEFTLTARAGTESDGMALTLPVHEDGIQQQTAASGRLARAAARHTLTLALPAKLARDRTTATVQLSPGHLATVLDALPYLVDYPYGCVEQTMSRFLPAVVARQTLVQLGCSAEAVERRILGRETSVDAARRARTAGLGRLDDVIALSLSRLAEASSYRGFGWWPGADNTDPWMTAYVAWGLTLAQESGVAAPKELVSQTQRALFDLFDHSRPDDDRLAWALAASVRIRDAKADAAKAQQAAFAQVYAARERLSPAGRACLALAARVLGTAEQRAVLLRNLENGAQRVRADDLGNTVHWGATGSYWRAMDGAVESTALTLLALLELAPEHPLAEPAAAWLALNRRSAHWASTRDTAFAALALTRYAALRGETQPDAEVEVSINGRTAGRVRLTKDSLLAASPVLTLDPAALQPGANRIELRRVAGDTPVYAVALSSAWAESATVQPAGHLAAVARDFVRQKAQPTLAGTLRIVPEPLAADGAANAGEQVTAKVTLTVPNELEYVMVAVPKPAGCEPLNPLSGWDARLLRVEPAAAASKASEQQEADEDRGRAIYREERDDRSVFFLDRVPAGTWEIRFGMRATTPGEFRALPVEAEAMYVPEVRANSDARRLRIAPRQAE